MAERNQPVTQLKLAREMFPSLSDGVALYRLRNPRSRAVQDWTYDGSGGKVRRAECIYCRQVVATCAAAWPETLMFRARAAEHSKECARDYVKRHGRRGLTLRMVLDAREGG